MAKMIFLADGSMMPKSYGMLLRFRTNVIADCGRCNCGFTLTELMIVLLIISLMSAFAVPGTLSLIDRYRLQANIGKVVSALGFSRGEAVKRGEKIIIERSGSTWNDGWRILEDVSRIELRTQPSLASSLVESSPSFQDFIRFNQSGTGNATGWFRLATSLNESASAICIGRTGHLKFSRCAEHTDPCEENSTCPGL